MTEPLELVRERLAERECGPRSGEQFDCRCPAHEDRHASLSVGSGADGRVLLKCHAGCEPEAVVAALGLTLPDLFPSRNGDSDDRRIVTTYTYEGADGKPVFRVVRTVPKGFWQQRWDGDDWVNGGARPKDRVLFRLPQVLEAIGAGQPVWLTEGEKDALALKRAGVTATTNPGGAEKWLPQFSETLRDADVVIVGDNDEAGLKHARFVAKELEGVAASVELKRCPEPHKDVSDLLGAGGKLDDLLALASVDDSAPGEARERPVTWASDIRKRRLRWTWKGRLALGYLAVWCGAGELGKSMFAIWVAKQLCEGTLDGEFYGNPQKVLIVATEDGRDDMWLPRLEAARVDPSRVGFLDYPPGWNVRDGVDWIDRAVADGDIALVLVDALMSHMPDARGGENTRSPTFVRAALGPLADLCKRRSTTVLFGLHPRKAGGETFSDVVQESGAFTQLPRLGLLFGYHPDDVDLPRDQQRRVCIRGKGNAGRNPGALSFRIAERFLDWEGDDPKGIADGVGYVTDVQECRLTERELLRPRGLRDQPQDVPKVELAMAVLRAALADGEWHLAGPIRAELEQIEANHNAVVDDAKNQLGVKSEKQKGVLHGPWWWQMDRSSNSGELSDSFGPARATLVPQLTLDPDSSPNPNENGKSQRVSGSERTNKRGDKESRVSNSSRAHAGAQDADSGTGDEQAPEDQQAEPRPPRPMYELVAEAITAVLSDGEWRWNVAIKDRLAALGLSHGDAMIARAKRHLAEHGYPIEMEKRPTDSGAESWWRMTAGQLGLDPSPDPASPDGPLVKQARRLYGGKS